MLTAQTCIEDFKQSFETKEEVSTHMSVPLPGAWLATPSGIVKVDWDAAVDAKCSRIGVGIIIRD
jgi:hypothetical protein